MSYLADTDLRRKFNASVEDSQDSVDGFLESHQHQLMYQVLLDSRQSLLDKACCSECCQYQCVLVHLLYLFDTSIN